MRRLYRFKHIYMLSAWIYYLIPFLFAVVGWLVAKVAVSMYLSAILKKRNSIGKAVGNYVANQFSFDSIEETLTNPESIEKILPFADEHIENFLRVKLPAAMPMLAMFISDKLVADMKSIFMKELKELFPALIQQYLTGVKNDLDISRLVSAKLDSVSSQSVASLLKKPMRVVDYACILTGFLCGCVYILLTLIA